MLPRVTHCIHGHPLSGENLYVEPNGKRRCRECRRNRDHLRRPLKNKGAPSDTCVQCGSQKRKPLSGGRYCPRCRSAYDARRWQDPAYRLRSLKAHDVWRRGVGRETFNATSRIATKTRRLRLRASGKVGVAAIRKIFSDQRGRCWWCGVSLDPDSFQIDHRYPVALGGDNSLSNLVASCASCNRKKGTRLPHEFCGRLL